jgi:DNA polymerase-1
LASVREASICFAKDELVFEVNASKADEFADKIKDLMQNAYQLDIPLKVDVGVGVSWQEAH